MHSRRSAIFAVFVCWSVTLAAKDSFKLAGKAEFNRAANATVDVEYTGPAPTANSPYLDPASWKVYWSIGSGDQVQVHVASITGVDIDATFQTLLLHLSGEVPPLNVKTWKVMFSPQTSTAEMPQIISGTALPHPPATADQAVPANSNASTEKKSCDGDSDQRPLFCPPPAGKAPDISLTGSFQAVGGSKPIYSLALKGALQSPRKALGFHPGVSTDVEINENKKPPQSTTSFNPDSITAGLAFIRTHAVERGILYGEKFELGLPNGEFSASDPSSNIIFNPAASLVLNSWQPRAYKSVAAKLYPFFALETGRNLSKPSTVAKVPVNFSNYNAILRGVLGADAAYMVKSPDRKSNLLSLTGSYRVRIPGYAEPQVRTLHEATTVTLGTNPRHWFEGDINYTPWSFKYLALTGKYQYGELPPLFKLVDHSFTIGFTLQAIQSLK